MTINEAIALTESQETGSDDTELPQWLLDLATEGTNNIYAAQIRQLEKQRG